MFFRAKVSPLASAELERGIRSVSPRKDRSDPRGCEWDHGGGGDGDGGGAAPSPRRGIWECADSDLANPKARQTSKMKRKSKY